MGSALILGTARHKHVSRFLSQLLGAGRIKRSNQLKNNTTIIIFFLCFLFFFFFGLLALDLAYLATYLDFGYKRHNLSNSRFFTFIMDPSPPKSYPFPCKQCRGRYRCHCAILEANGYCFTCRSYSCLIKESIIIACSTCKGMYECFCEFLSTEHKN